VTPFGKVESIAVRRDVVLVAIINRQAGPISSPQIIIQRRSDRIQGNADGQNVTTSDGNHHGNQAVGYGNLVVNGAWTSHDSP